MANWIVNVWFGTAEAEVSESFASEAEANEFASGYSVEEYPEAIVSVFPPED